MNRGIPLMFDDGVVVNDPNEPDALLVCQNENCLRYIYKSESAVVEDNGDIVHAACQRGGYEF